MKRRGHRQSSLRQPGCAQIEAFLEDASEWREGMARLRAIALDCGLGEELKWGKPCYTLGAANVAIIQPFKRQFALMFFKGSLLEDPQGLLRRPGANSHVARRLEFSDAAQVAEQERRIRGFIAAAIELERAGRQVEERREPDPHPDELLAMFTEVGGLKRAFLALTPGRQRGYLLHFTGARRSATRRSRIERCVPRILAGRGLRE